MGKENGIVVWSFGLYLLMNVFTFLGHDWQLPGSFLWLAGAWVIVSVILFFIVLHKGVSVIYIMANAIMAGLAIATYYGIKKLPVYPINDMLWWGVVIFGIQAVVMNLVRTSYKINIGLACGSVAGIMYGIYHIWQGFVVWGSAFIFLFVFMLCLNVTLWYDRKRGKSLDTIEVLKLTSMLMFGGVLIAVLCLLSDGDVLEFFAHVGDAGIETKAARKKS